MTILSQGKPFMLALLHMQVFYTFMFEQYNKGKWNDYSCFQTSTNQFITPPIAAMLSVFVAITVLFCSTVTRPAIAVPYPSVQKNPPG
jgi:hypothetical protein